MYLNRVNITNIRTLQSVRWILQQSSPAGWHVILGENGSGKSTFLRAISLALLGPELAMGFGQTGDYWKRTGTTAASKVTIQLEQDAKFDFFSGKGYTKKTGLLDELTIQFGQHADHPMGIWGQGSRRDAWGTGKGWFSAGFGPYRRFRGGDPNRQKDFYVQPKRGRHLTLFDEGIALSECMSWLQSLKFKLLEKLPEGQLLLKVKDFINQSEMLPFQTTFQDATSETVQFVDGNGTTVDVELLSDGFRSILSLIFELFRQLAAVFSIEEIFDADDVTKVLVPGVVLIDEVDAHLHPTWQQKIGHWLTGHFPNMQFIVTTHSPLICQAAETGSVFKLPRPGSEEQGRFMKGEELNRLVYGSVQEAYGTTAFGEGVTRSASSLAKLQQLAELNLKELRERLTPKERSLQQELRQMMPTAAYSTNGEE